MTTASTITGLSAPAILEDFGEFIVPDLLGIYGSLVKPEWRTLDFLEQTKDTIHRVVRFRNPGAMPPELAVKRTGDHEVVILYTSQRKMCSVAKGIIRGVAKHYGDPIEIDESHCMLKGHPQCTIEVRTL